MRISDWSSDVCSSDLCRRLHAILRGRGCGLLLRQYWRAFGAINYTGKGPGTGGNRMNKKANKTVLETILDWSADRPLWQRDALRRIVTGGTPDDARSEERRVGKEGVSTGRSRWAA